MVTIIRTRYTDSRAGIRLVRDEVFINEQGISAGLEEDGRDDLCLHVLVLDGGAPIGTGRIDPEKHGKIGRVAVLAPLRRQGIGTLIMDELEKIAALEGLERVWFHAQDSAVDFYEKMGYRSTGSPFKEAGIGHIRMEKDL